MSRALFIVARMQSLESWLERARTVARTPLFEVAGTEITLEKILLSALFFAFALAIS